MIYRSTGQGFNAAVNVCNLQSKFERVKFVACGQVLLYFESFERFDTGLTKIKKSMKKNTHTK